MKRPFAVSNALLVGGLALGLGTRPAAAQTLIDFETFSLTDGTTIPNDTQINSIRWASLCSARP